MPLSPPKKGTLPHDSALAKGKKDSNGKGKMGGPEVGVNGPFCKGQKLIQCFKCGGWGHMAWVCPSQGNQDWRNLNGVDNSPDQKGPVTQKKQ